MRNRIVTAVKQRFSIRKLSIGAASVLVGTSLYFMGGSATIVHADTTGAPADTTGAPAAPEKEKTGTNDPVYVAKDSTKNDADVNNAIDKYAEYALEHDLKNKDNKVIIRPSDKQPVKVNTIKDRVNQVNNIQNDIQTKIKKANQGWDAINTCKKSNNHEIIDGKDSSYFENQSLSVDDEKDSEINQITVTDGSKTKNVNTKLVDRKSKNIDGLVDGQSKNIDGYGINITHTSYITDKEKYTMKVNSNNKVIVDFQDNQCKGKEITVTYDNLNNSYYLENKTNRIKISRIDRTFSSIIQADNSHLFNPNGKDTYKNDAIYDECREPQLIIYNDPSDGFFYNNIKQISVKDTYYYDDKGEQKPIDIKNPAWVFVTSLNSNPSGNIEKVRALRPDNSPVPVPVLVPVNAEKIAGSTVTDHNDGWCYSNINNNFSNNANNIFGQKLDWDNNDEYNRFGFVGTVAFQYHPGMTLQYRADDSQWGSHWACMQTQVVSSLNENVIIYGHIKDGVQEVTPDNPGKPINPNDPDGPKWPAGTDEDGLSKDVTEHITYTGLPATETPAEVTHVLKFTGSGYLDKVTGKWTDKDGKELEDQSLDKALEWTAQEGNAFDEVPSPSKAGYYVARVDVKVGDQQLDKDTDEYSAYTDGKDVKAVENITHNHENIVMTVIYAPCQKAGLTIIDENTGNHLGDYSDTGKSGKDIAFTGAKDAVDAYLKAGYIWDSAKNNADKYEGLKFGKLDKDASKDQNWTIYLKHGKVTVTPDNPGHPDAPINPNDPDGPKWPAGTDEDGLSKDVTEHITYTGLPATETPAEVTHVLKFTGSGYLDKVTGKWTDKDGKELEDQSLDKALEWTAQEGNAFDEVPSPSKAGYYVARVDVKVGDQQLDKDTDEYSAYTDGKDVKAVENITHNHENIVMTVIYAPCQKAGLTIIDENTGNHLGDYSDTGKSGKDIAFTGAKDAVDAYLKAGYIWDSAKNNADKYEGLKFGKLDKDASKDQNWTIYLKHGKVTVTPDNPGHPDAPINPNDPDGPKWPAGTDKDSLTKTGTQTIHYVGAGDKTPADNTQTYAFIKNMVIDKVTGKVLDPGSWNIDSYTFGTVKTPVIPGYHADKAVAGGETVTPDDLNKVITVTYAPDGNPGNPSDHGDTPSPEPTPEPETTPNPTPDDQPDSETSSDEHFEKVKAKDKLDKTNPKKVDAYKKQRKIIKTKIAKQGHTEIAEPIEDKVTRENNVKVVSDPVENMAAEPKLPQTGEADNSIIGLLGMLLASFAAMFGFDSLHSHDKKHKN